MEPLAPNTRALTYRGRLYFILATGSVYAIRPDSRKLYKVKQHCHTAGYPIIGVRTEKGVCTMAYVHRLVALAFLGDPPIGKPQVNHIDGDKTNSHVDNLEWCSANENRAHAFRTGLSKTDQSSMAIVGRKKGSIIRFKSQNEAERAGFHCGNIGACIAGKRKTHAGYTWEKAT